MCLRWLVTMVAPPACLVLPQIVVVVVVDQCLAIERGSALVPLALIESDTNRIALGLV